MKEVRQADDPFVCFGEKPDKGFRLEISDTTGSRQGNAREEGVGEGRRRRTVGSRHRTAEEISRHEIGSSSSKGRPVKMSQHCSWFVEISLEIHASVSLQMHKGMQSITTLFFPPTPLIVFLVAMKKCAIPLSEPLDDSPAKIEMV